MAPVARELGDGFRAIEVIQRSGANGGVTVERHVDDLHECIGAYGGGEPALVLGHSWGAMLALAYGAAHPAALAGLVAVGSGTFDVASRRRLAELRGERLGEPVRRLVDRVEGSGLSPSEQMRRVSVMMFKADSHDLAEAGAPASFDAAGHDGSWADAMRLQSEGVHPAAFGAIEAPVVMVHGEHDTHPGEMIRDSLLPHLPRLEYVKLARCGHYPWLERHARDRFYEVVRGWLTARL